MQLRVMTLLLIKGLSKPWHIPVTGLIAVRSLDQICRLHQNRPFISKLCEKGKFRRRRVLSHLIHYWWYINNLREVACLRWQGIKSIFTGRVDSNSYVGQRKGEPRLLIILAFILLFQKKPFHKK